jgi:hypothetical protein
MCFVKWKHVWFNCKKNEMLKESITVPTYTEGVGTYCSKTSINITTMNYIQKFLHLSVTFCSICVWYFPSSGMSPKITQRLKTGRCWEVKSSKIPC